MYATIQSEYFHNFHCRVKAEPIISTQDYNVYELVDSQFPNDIISKSNNTGKKKVFRHIALDNQNNGYLFDIKLKTLTIGKEDIHRFGYWQKDLERSERLIGLKEGGIVNELENIKAEKRSNAAKEFAIRSRLRNIGFEVSTINSVPSNSNQLKITDKQEYLRAYNNSV